MRYDEAFKSSILAPTALQLCVDETQRHRPPLPRKRPSYNSSQSIRLPAHRTGGYLTHSSISSPSPPPTSGSLLSAGKKNIPVLAEIVATRGISLPCLEFSKRHAPFATGLLQLSALMTSKVFIVTGASKGLGAAIVEHLLAQSHKVVVTARSEEPLRKLKDAYPTQVEYLAGDITSAGVGFVFKACKLLFFYMLRNI